MKQSSHNPKSLLWIGAFSNNVHDYVHELVHHLHFPFNEALNFLGADDRKIDAYIITSVHKTSEILAIKKIASKKNIPVILYSPSFELRTKELTVELGIDEYCYGVLSGTVIGRVETLKKLKDYKIQNRSLPSKSAGLLLMKTYRGAAKRLFDILLSLFILAISIVFFPVLLIYRFASNRPIFDVSKRVGFGYKTFDYYKFWTTADDTNSETKSNNYFELFLRSNGLNELPAFFNVLRGDISIVGTRPLLQSEAEKLTEDQIAIRFMTPAGITGLWRITFQDQPARDIEYTLDNSFGKDIKILFLTLLLPFKERKLKLEPEIDG